MIISKLSPHDELKYNEMAMKVGSIFNTTNWSKIFGRGVQQYGIYNKGGELVGGFFLYKKGKLGLLIYCNPPFTPTIGPFLNVEAQNPVSVMDTWKKTLSLMTDFINKLSYSIVSISLNKNIIDTQPFIWAKFKVVPGYTYLLDLSVSIEEIRKRMSNERRKNINKATKDGLLVRKVYDFGTIKNLVLKTFSRQDEEINEFYLNKILFEFANNNNSFAFATYKDDIPIACTFCIYDSKTAYYLLGGYDSEDKHHGAGALSLWEAIKYAKESGLKSFDFEGSMIPQIEKYFRGFGGQLTPYYRINKAKLPIELLLKFFKRELF